MIKTSFMETLANHEPHKILYNLNNKYATFTLILQK